MNMDTELINYLENILNDNYTALTDNPILEYGHDKRMLIHTEIRMAARKLAKMKLRARVVIEPIPLEEMKE